jgi:hypothetical protein
MIVDNLNFSGTLAPLENDSPLIVDTNRVVSPQSSFKPFQAVAWRNLQVIQTNGRIQILQLPLRDVSEGRGPRWKRD